MQNITEKEFKNISNEIRVAFLNPNKQKREEIIKPILKDILNKYQKCDEIVLSIFVNVELDRPELNKLYKEVKNEHISY